MKKMSLTYFLLLLVSMCLSGCGAVGEKMTSMSIIYAITAAVSLLLLILFNCVVQKKDVWYQLLFSSIFIVNLGYFTLSISKTIEEALLANRISYLGSVFLPMSMFLLILNVSKIKYRKWLPIMLLFTGVGVFLIAASPGYSTIYYKEVFLTVKNGATVLKKVYGPLHSIYLYYLLGYFSVMVITLIYTTSRKKMASNIQAFMLLSAVFINIFVWLIEQLIHIDFEMLSVSYIISELFLIGLQLMIANVPQLEQVPNTPAVPDTSGISDASGVTDVSDASDMSDVADASGTVDTSDAADASGAVDTSDVADTSGTVDTSDVADTSGATDTSGVSEDRFAFYIDGIAGLTPTERIIYNLYLSGNTTKEIMASLNIKENTLKFHNKNIYTKLGVTSRKQLIEIGKQLEQNSPESLQ